MKQLEEIEARATRAALDPLVLPDLLWSVRTMIGGVMGTMERYDKRTGTVEMLTTDRPDILAEGRAAYESHYYKVNRRNDLAMELRPGTILCDDLLGDDRALSRDEFYVDFLAPSGLKYFIGAVLIDDDEQLVWTSVQRGPKQPRVSAEKKRAYAAALPHLGNALSLYLRMRNLPAAPVLADLLDRITDPMAIVRVDGGLLFANRAMRDMVDDDRWLTLDEGRLESRYAPLRRAVARLMAAAANGERSGCAAVTLPGRRRPVVLRAVALPEERSRPYGAPLLCLMIDDPGRPKIDALADIARQYELTPREAAVGAHLAAGWTIAETALKLGISRNTVRTHVAHLREKLGERSMLGVAARLRSASAALH
ncbi:MAG: helix-turn-helix transcriptional regulator [Parasphingopyxis sp.]|uniref:helix-turn-helix transcriptional regulator n=1 Tax=Parasphingopyxis sp. TaxID=1920299 RepID=UPI003F9F7DFE